MLPPRARRLVLWTILLEQAVGGESDASLPAPRRPRQPLPRRVRVMGQARGAVHGGQFVEDAPGCCTAPGGGVAQGPAHAHGQARALRPAPHVHVRLGPKLRPGLGSGLGPGHEARARARAGLHACVGGVAAAAVAAGSMFFRSCGFHLTLPLPTPGSPHQAFRGIHSSRFNLGRASKNRIWTDARDASCGSGGRSPWESAHADRMGNPRDDTRGYQMTEGRFLACVTDSRNHSLSSSSVSCATNILYNPLMDQRLDIASAPWPHDIEKARLYVQETRLVECLK